MSDLKFKPCWKKRMQIEYAEITEPMTIETKEGNLTADPEKDFVLRGVQGELYPCKKDIFAQTYDTHFPAPPASAREVTRAIGDMMSPLVVPCSLDDKINALITAYAERVRADKQAEIAGLVDRCAIYLKRLVQFEDTVRAMKIRLDTKLAEIDGLKSELEYTKDNFRHADYTYDQKLAALEKRLADERAAAELMKHGQSLEIRRLNCLRADKQAEIAALRKREGEAREIIEEINKSEIIGPTATNGDIANGLNVYCLICGEKGGHPWSINHKSDCLKTRARRWLEGGRHVTMNKYINPDIRCTLDPDTDGYCCSYKQYIDKGEEFLKLETVKRCKQIKSMRDICLHCVYWVR